VASMPNPFAFRPGVTFENSGHPSLQSPCPANPDHEQPAALPGPNLVKAFHGCQRADYHG
jgi:hypothetical protein